MSPASSGALEIERYIGACLISSQQSRQKSKPGNFAHQYVDGRYHRVQRCGSGDGWAGGMPLISFNNSQRWRRPENNARLENHIPLARLAVHTQGAPLILSNRYNHRKIKQHPRNSPPKVSVEKDSNVCGTDTVSVASDESSGSANSENCLPRIIKPRKRRKKERKPPHLLRPISQDGSFSTDSTSPDIDSPSAIVSFMPYFPYSYDFAPVVESVSNTSKYSDISETPNLHHSFEDVQDFDSSKDVNGNQTESSCQCRYCDPTGQIWDIDKSCYSPYLTTPGRTSFQYPETTKSYASSVSSSQHQCLLDSMSSLSLDEDKSAACSLRSSGDLEVSTEIVTSLNGHRDLEIKFFSTSLESAKSRDATVCAVIDKDDAESYDKSEKCSSPCSVNICSSFATEE